MQTRISVIVISLLLMFPVIALADRNTSEAKRLFAEGTRLYNVGRYEEALKRFESAYLLKPDPALLFNLGPSAATNGAIRRGGTKLSRIPA
jgi:hypothetical protein